MSALQPITANDLGVSYRGHPVFSGVDVTVQPGRRIGLVGENGSGKSTLLRAIAGRLPSTATITGAIDRPDDLVLLTQEPPFPDAATVAEVLASTLKPLRDAVVELELLAENLDDPETAQTYADKLEWAVAHDAWDADRRATQAADELGLAGLTRKGDRVVGTLSGGQRTRLAMATIMTRRPEALLLDEPTNHLDDDAISLLTEFLRTLPGVVLFASHDRVFLDDVATDLLDLEPGNGDPVQRFGGGWSEYEDERRKARQRWEETYASQQDELKQLRAATKIGTSAIAHNRGPTDNDKFIYKFKGGNVDRTVARRKRDAERRLEEAESHQVRKPPKPLRLGTSLTTEGASGRIVQVRDLVVKERLQLDRLDVDAGGHVLVTGPNGVGKSTLLGVLSGRIPPTTGEVRVGAHQVAELTQDPIFSDDTSTPTRIYRDAVGEKRSDEVPLRTLGLVHPRDLAKPVGALSVGQRRRLSLALAVATGPDLLLLDEPTNHISLALAGELEEAVQTSPGTVIVASHDRWLRRRWAGLTIELGRPESVRRRAAE